MITSASRSPRSVLLTTLLVSGLVLGLTSAALADTITLTSVKDNTLYNGSDSAASNGAGSNMFVGVTSFDGDRRGLVQFDLSGIPAGSTINSATLTLFADKGSFLSPTIEVHRVSRSWGEGTSVAIGAGGQGGPASTGDATWAMAFYPSTAWTTPGGDFSATISASLVPGFGDCVWSGAGLAADAQAWVDSPDANFGWILRPAADTDTNTTRRFLTREAASNRPMLVIDYTPPVGCPCAADFDDSGGTPDASDIDAFFASWLAGEESADSDCSGGTPDASDIDQFFLEWLAGGC